jgi:hypothetical protein
MKLGTLLRIAAIYMGVVGTGLILAPPSGWRMWRVDEVEEGALLIDGKPPS